LLLQKGKVLEERDFFKDRFTEDEIRGLAAIVGLSDMFAWRSPSIKQMGLAGQQIAEDQMLKLMLQEPRLVRRPLIKLGDRLLVGGNIKAIEAALAGE
jgi:arsenate reductase-like glutaredoxin family protein